MASRSNYFLYYGGVTSGGGDVYTDLVEDCTIIGVRWTGWVTHNTGVALTYWQYELSLSGQYNLSGLNNAVGLIDVAAGSWHYVAGAVNLTRCSIDRVVPGLAIPMKRATRLYLNRYFAVAPNAGAAMCIVDVK